MSVKNKKQFGVWMDSHSAVVVGKPEESEEFLIIGNVSNNGAANNSNENASNNHDIALTQKFFKEIAAKMPNVDEIHITGTGQIQEQFIKFLGDTAQYKNANATHSTANKMSDENLIEYIEKIYN